MGRTIKVLVLLSLVAVMASGCSKKPVQDIDAVMQAVQAAAAAEAKEYAPQALARAEDARAQMDAEIKVQDGKFVLFRSYKKSQELAVAAKAAAADAAKQAATAKEQARVDASNLISQAKMVAEETRALLAKAPRGKGSAADIKAMEADITAAEASLAQAEALFTDGAFLKAKVRADAVRKDIENIKQAINQAIEAKKAGRK
jgi:hypothetical protein